MLIDIKNLKLQLKTKETFNIQASLPEGLLGDYEGRFTKPSSIELTVERNGKYYWAHGEVMADLELHCSRCLKPVAYSVNAVLDFTLVESIYKDEFNAEETEVIFFHDTQIDLTPIVQETVVLNLPLRTFCKEDCQGICSGCGVDKNYEACKCETDPIDPRWEKLKNLQTGKEV